MAAFLIHHPTQRLAHKFVGGTEAVRVGSLLDVSFQFRCQAYAHVSNIFQAHWGFKISLADREEKEIRSRGPIFPFRILEILATKIASPAGTKITTSGQRLTSICQLCQLTAVVTLSIIDNAQFRHASKCSVARDQPQPPHPRRGGDPVVVFAQSLPGNFPGDATSFPRHLLRQK